MAKILKLDRKVADLIAAGEVVERPSSVVKELLENAIDAGAHSVSVDISHGGLRSIRVTDDGCGIEREDVPVAFLRHATSKVRTAQDLAAIGTMGFRGEALASIAAVSRVEIRTKTAQELAGFIYRIEGGEETGSDECGMQTGSVVTVSDLFYNTPARMKFVKHEAAEAGLVQTVVRSAALSRPDVAFEFLREGTRVFGTPGDGKLMSAVYAALGREFAAGLAPVSRSRDGITVSGLVSKPSWSQGNRRRQEFFVNRRPVKSRLLSAAVEDAYRGSIMLGRFPACVLHIELELETVDVNVHPAKTEVKFALESVVRDAVRDAVAAALREADPRVELRERMVGSVRASVRRAQSAQGTPAVPPPVRNGKPEKPRVNARPVPPQMRDEDFYREMTVSEYRKLRGLDCAESGSAATKQTVARLNPTPSDAERRTETGSVIPLRTLAPVERRAEPEVRQQLFFGGVTLPDSRPVKPVIAPAPTTIPAHTPKTARVSADMPVQEVVYEPAEEPEKAAETVKMVLTAEEPQVTISADGWRTIGELFNTYILVERGDELLLIDKHAAHERMRYEALLESAPSSMSQMLMEPLVFTPEAAERELLLSESSLLREIGFEIEDFGGGSIIVRAAPDELERDECEAALDEIAENLAVSRRAPRTEKREAALRLVACKSAMRAGAVTTPAERDALVARVLGDDDIRFCPHGRPVVAVLSRGEIERRIGRQT